MSKEAEKRSKGLSCLRWHSKLQTLYIKKCTEKRISCKCVNQWVFYKESLARWSRENTRTNYCKYTWSDWHHSWGIQSQFFYITENQNRTWISFSFWLLSKYCCVGWAATSCKARAEFVSSVKGKNTIYSTVR